MLNTDGNIDCRNQPLTHQFIFDLYDTDGDGSISSDEVFKYLTYKTETENEDMFEARLCEHARMHACTCTCLHT